MDFVKSILSEAMILEEICNETLPEIAGAKTEVSDEHQHDLCQDRSRRVSCTASFIGACCRMG